MGDALSVPFIVSCLNSICDVLKPNSNITVNTKRILINNAITCFEGLFL